MSDLNIIEKANWERLLEKHNRKLSEINNRQN